jgi:hypothetical protein
MEAARQRAQQAMEADRLKVAAMKSPPPPPVAAAKKTPKKTPAKKSTSTPATSTRPKRSSAAPPSSSKKTLSLAPTPSRRSTRQRTPVIETAEALSSSGHLVDVVPTPPTVTTPKTEPRKGLRTEIKLALMALLLLVIKLTVQSPVVMETTSGILTDVKELLRLGSDVKPIVRPTSNSKPVQAAPVQTEQTQASTSEEQESKQCGSDDGHGHGGCALPGDGDETAPPALAQRVKEHQQRRTTEQ